jgi:transposase
MGSDRPATRRRYSAAVKEQVLAECAVPGASVAKVAMAHGINANVLHRWRQLAREDRSPTIEPREAARQFVPVTIAAEPATKLPDIQIQLRRGQTTLTIAWPASAAAECAAWVRELLR